MSGSAAAAVLQEPEPVTDPASLLSAGLGMAVFADDPLLAPAKRVYRLSEAGRAVKAAHARKISAAGTAAGLLKQGTESRSEAGKKGAAILAQRTKLLQDACRPENPEGIKARRILLEGRRDGLLGALITAAEGGKALKADLGVIKAALSEIRAEIALLFDREDRARKAGAAGGVGVPAVMAAAAPYAVPVAAAPTLPPGAVVLSSGDVAPD